ncbi:MAG: hypothetical protein QW429_03890 [Thermoprotei archaeon]
MTLKFLYITDDPYTNQSNEYVRILDISYFEIANFSSSVNGNGVGSWGQLYDNNGTYITSFVVSWSTWLEQTEATGYPYAYSGVYGVWSQRVLIIPPGWTFKNFQRALAVQGTLEEVLRVH